MQRAEGAKDVVLSMDVHLLAPPSLILNTLEHFGIETLQDLLNLDMERVAARRGVGTSKFDALTELIERAEAMLEAEPDEVRAVGASQPTLLDELVAAGIDPDQPWTRVLVHLKTRTRNLLTHSDIYTLRDLVVRFEADTLTRIAGFGETSKARVGTELDRLILLGEQAYIWGEETPPQTAAGAIAYIISTFEGTEDHPILTMRYDEGATLEEIGEEMGLSRERIRQRLERALERSTHRYGGALGEFLIQLIARLKRCPVLTRAQVFALPQCEALGEGRLVLATELVQVAARWVRDGAFLTCYEPHEWEDVWSTIRAHLSDCAQDIVPPAQLALWTESFDWEVDADDIAELIAARWGVSRGPEGGVVNPWMASSELYAEVVRRIGEPVEISALGEVIQRQLNLERPPTERQIYLGLTRATQIYSVGRGVYAHADGLSVDTDALDALADRAIEELRGTTHAVSTAALLDTLSDEQDDEVAEQVSAMLLRDVMSRHPRIKVFQSTDMVAHLDSFQGTRRTHEDHVTEILATAMEAMTAAQVCEAMPEHVSFHEGAIYMALQSAPEILSLGHATFMHQGSIGLTEALLNDVVARALDRLRDVHPAPRHAQVLLTEMTGTPAAAFLAAHTMGDRILCALLDRHDEVSIGSSQLVIWDNTSHGTDPVMCGIEEVLREQVLATPSDIGAQMSVAFGWEGALRPIYYALEKMEASGDVVRVLRSWRALANTDTDALVEALVAREVDPLDLVHADDGADLTDEDRALLIAYAEAVGDEARATALRAHA